MQVSRPWCGRSSEGRKTGMESRRKNKLDVAVDCMAETKVRGSKKVTQMHCGNSLLDPSTFGSSQTGTRTCHEPLG